ncbi:MAG: hypothetical protein ABSF24_10140 [Candidatus Bathyarchaeia archaeon]|jgi:hypothetical protein
MRLVPSRKVCEKFWITYDFKGCQKAVDFLTRHYGIRRMKIVLDGKKVHKKSWLACYYYDQHTAYFKKRGLTKRYVLHELYHHIVNAKGLETSSREEEKQASAYSCNFARKARG